MGETITLVLPAIEVPDHITDTPAGAVRVPGTRIPEKHVAIDAELLSELLTKARNAAAKAHAPHSHFHVGAAVIMADDPSGAVHCGANVENSSYGVTVCGERNALFGAVAKGFRRIKYLAVSTTDSLGGPLSERSPCGVCRQAIREFTGADVTLDDALILIDSGEDGVLCDVVDIERLLPHGFTFPE
ncbi:MAG: cytidine deaminase [Proteobacteria bacterium]|nr:cytidine deaminase [Pseudomonadota bacterium]